MLGRLPKVHDWEKPSEWVLWVPLVEWWYNSNWDSSTGVTPFEAVYGQTPTIHIPYLAGDNRVKAVDRSLRLGWSAFTC